MNPEPPSTLLWRHHLKVLKLPTMLRDYAAVAAACGQECVDYAGFLLRLAERELLERERKATALGFAACTAGGRVRFTTITALVTLLLEMRENRLRQRFHKQLERLDLLILDELGYVPFTKAGAELLFDVVARAYERSSLIVTTNLPFEKWTEVLGSERLTGAMLDRLTHRVHILEANGESYRLADAKRRLRRK